MQIIFTGKSQKMRRTIGVIGISLLIVLPTMTYAEAPTQTTSIDIYKVASEGNSIRKNESCTPRMRALPGSRMDRLINRNSHNSKVEAKRSFKGDNELSEEAAL